MQDYNTPAIYALAGRALHAAQTLRREIEEGLKTTPILRTSAEGTRKSIDLFHNRLLARLERDAPDVLALTGLTSPATQVYQGPQTLPRAYQALPRIFVSEADQSYYLYAPVDYKGNHFVPLDSKRLTGKAVRAADDRLFPNEFAETPPLLSLPRIGVATPDDYKAPRKSTLAKAFSYIRHDWLCYIPAGRTLDIINDYHNRIHEWKSRIKTASHAIEAEIKAIKPAILATLPAGEDIHINSSCRYHDSGGNKAEILISARRMGLNGDGTAGRTVDIPSIPAFIATRQEGGDYIITPNTNSKQGRKIAALIDDIPLTPSLNDYPELIAPFDRPYIRPQLSTRCGHTFLLYGVVHGTKPQPFCPPDAKPVPAQLYHWLDSDQGDLNTGVKAPPRPEAIQALLREIAHPAPAQPKPQP